MNNLIKIISGVLISILGLASPGVAADWPGFLGPNGNGALDSEDIPSAWPKNGPLIKWRLAVGEGCGGPAVSGGKLILMHREKDHHVLDCVEATTGKRIWRHISPTNYDDSLGRGKGPRCTPLIKGGRVFVTTPEAGILAVSLATGKELWKVDLASQYSPPKGFFGYGVSPLGWHDLILLNVGGEGSGIVAFEAATGIEKWKATSQSASYCTGLLALLMDRERAIFLTRDGMVVLNPATGEVVDQRPWRSRQGASVNAASPVEIPGGIFLSACYGTGAVVLHESNGVLKPRWSNDESLSAHYSTPVYHQGNLYGFHGRQEEGGELRCVEVKTGKVQWKRTGTGCGWIIRARNRFLVMEENGMMLLLESNSQACQILAGFQALDGPIRAVPAYSEGMLYCRDNKQLKALQLRP